MARLRFETDLANTLKAGSDSAKAFDKVGDTLRKSAAEAKALERAAKRIVDQNLTPTERYNQKLETLSKAFVRGKITVEDMDRTLVRMRQKLEQTGEVQKRTFGDAAINKLAGVATGYIGISRVVGAVSESLRQMEADADRASSATLNSLGAIGELQQLASGDTREERSRSFLGLLGEARGLIGPVYTPEQQTEAVSLVTQLKAQGFTQPGRQFFYEALGELAVDPKNAIELSKGIGKFTTQTGGKPEDVFAEVLRGSVPGTSTAAEFALHSLKPLKAGKALGLSRQEILAGTAIAELSAQNVDVGSTEFNSFLEQVDKRGLGGGDLQMILDRVQARIDKGKTVYDVLGEARAVRGFRGLQDQRSQLDSLEAGVSAAPGGDVLAEHFGLFRSDPRARASQRKKIEEGAYIETVGELSQEREDLFDAVKARRSRRAREQGLFFGLMEFIGQQTVGRIEDALGAETGVIRGEARGQRRRGETSGLRTDIEDYLRRIAESNERIESEDRRTPPRASGRQE